MTTTPDPMLADDRSDPVLSARGLRLGYADLTAVWDVDIDVRSGRTTALLGRNGAGKTTLLRGLVGLLPAKAGSITLQGRDITGLPSWERVGRGLAIVQEGKRIFRNLTVAENIAVSTPRRMSRSARAAALDRIWSDFPVLTERRDRLGGELSGGQQQMLNIASAIVARPAVLLVDEPSSGLSPLAVEQVLKVIDQLRADGIAILLVEQVIEDVLGGFADDVVLIDQGRVLLREEAADVSFDRVAETMFGPRAVS
jgi:branched-chain amino acid transport system ATP-binding protein